MMQFSRSNTCNPSSRHTTTTLNASSPSSIMNALTGLSSDNTSSVNNNDSGLMLNLNCFDQELSFYPMFHGHGHMHVSPSQSSSCQNNNDGECNGHCTDPTQKSNRRLSCPHCSQQLQEIVSREQTEKKEWLRNLQLQQEQQLSTAEKHVSICAPYEHVLKEDQWSQFIQQETYFDPYVLNQEEDESNQSQSSCDSNPAGQESSMMKLLMSSSLLPLEEAISSVVGFQSTCTTIVDDKKDSGGIHYSNLEQVSSDECQQVATSLSNESTTNKSTTDGVGGEKEKRTRKRKRDFTNNTLTPVRNKFKKCKRPYDMYLQKFSFL